MAFIGDIPRFYGYDDWQVYTERLEQFFEVNDVADGKKKAILITSIDDRIYKTLRDVCHPALPKDKTFDELIALLDKQYIVKTSVFRERYNFYNAKQLSDETITNWFARIKKLSIDCKFGENFEKILLDRFISGLRPSPVLDRLCEEDESKLTLQAAVDLALIKEASVKDSYVEEADDGDDDGNKQGQGRRRRRKNKNANN